MKGGCIEIPQKWDRSIFSKKLMKKSESNLISDAKRASFIKNSWEILSLSQTLLKKRLKRAEKNEKAIDMLIEEISSIPQGELSDEERHSIAKNLAALKIDDMSKLSTVISSVYDKAALAEGKTTLNIGGELETSVKKFEDL